MDNIYSNSDIVFSHLDKRQEAGTFKGDQDESIYANTPDTSPEEKQSSSAEHRGSSPLSTAEKTSAPCRCAQILLAVICFALLGGLIALGILYSQKSDRADSLEDEKSRLSVSLSSVEQRLAGSERALAELELRHKNVLEELSSYRGLQRSLEELQAKNAELSKAVSNYRARDECACFRDWKLHQGKCYFLSTEKMNWLQSQAYCVSKGAHLVIIKSQQEQDFVSSSIRETHWIGMSDRDSEGQWVWVDGTPLDKSEPQFWQGHEPDNWTGGGDPAGEDCASLGDHNGAVTNWFDASCKKIKRFVCETDRI